VRVALCQITTRAGDVRGNVRRITAALEEARAQGARLAILPELAIPGYPPLDLLQREEFLADVRAAEVAIAEAARALGLKVIVGSVGGEVCGRDGPPTLANEAILLEGGRVRARRAKTLLPSYGVFHEARWFAPAREVAPVHLERGGAGPRSLGLLVCEDMWDEAYATHPPRDLLGGGAEALIAISASPYRKDVHAARLHHARRHGAPLVYVNAVGAEDALVFDGGGFALDRRGRVLLALPRFEEAVACVEWEALVGEAPVEADAPDLSLERERLAALTLGVRDFAAKKGIGRAVLGLSGGIDSALTAVIAARALGPGRVHGVAIPSRHTDPRSTEDARALAATLGIGFSVVPLEPLHAAMEASLAPLLAAARDEGARGLALENGQSRLRMVVLMAETNARGGLLLSTSNKSELSLGYGTIYGDMAGALAPLGDLWKSDVVALARHLEAQARGTFPPFTLARPPSAELRPEQTDPFDYAAVDPVLEALVLGGPAAEIEARAKANGLAPDEVARLERLVRAGEWKRRQGPVVLKVAETTFGPGRMVPVVDHTRPLATTHSPPLSDPAPPAAGARRTA